MDTSREALPGQTSSTTWKGPILPVDLAQVPIAPDGPDVALHPLGEGSDDVHLERQPVVLVPGAGGPLSILQAVVDTVRRSPRHQAWLACWRGHGLIGQALAAELRHLAAVIGPGRELTLIAHGLGGLQVRQALNLLRGAGDLPFGRITVLAVDTPWHGHPADHADELLRADSPLFLGEAGLYARPLPAAVHLELAFAEKGGTIVDFTGARMRGLAEALLADPAVARPITDDPGLKNLWAGLCGSSSWPDFRRELDTLTARRRLMPATLQALIGRHWRHWPGDHEGILQRPRDGRPCWLDHLATRLGIPAR